MLGSADLSRWLATAKPEAYILPLSYLLFSYTRTYGSRTADSRRV